MSEKSDLDFEQLRGATPPDETDISLRAYVCGLPPERLTQYDPSWTDAQVMEWDGNFRSDDALMLVCCERDVGVAEFRRVVEEFVAYRQIH